MPFSVRQKLGAIGYDLPRFEWWLHRGWTLVRNRSETLEAAPDGEGIRCCWRWTSELHLANVFPSTGRRLLQRALRDWPISFAAAPPYAGGSPQVSFVIGHRGTARVSQLLATLATIGAQAGVTFECIVVEQSVTPEIRGLLPEWVRYLHTPLPDADMPYSRSWTLNTGAQVARGSLLILHDNDMLVPKAYAAELWARHREGYDVINLKRFVFYLNERHSGRVVESRVVFTDEPVDTIVQNLEAGGSVAISREAFLAIGGFDESFVGWGGEDNEFWERAQTRRLWPYGYLPIVHLWHPAQPRKADPANPNLSRYKERSSLPPERRIAELALRKFGQAERLSVEWTTS